jgi:phosphoglycerate dehydrogenase-like enzyme
MKAVINPDIQVAPDLDAHITDRTDDTGLTVFYPDDEQAFQRHLTDADILFTGHWDPAYLETADDLQWIQSVSAGYDHFPVDTLRRENIHLTTASGVHPKPIAEHVFGYVLGLERNLFDTHEARTDRRWNREPLPEVHGKTMGIIGVGAIGKELARTATAFDLTVHGLDPAPDSSSPHVDRWYEPDALQALLNDIDYLVLACPLNDSTRRMIGQDELERLPEDALLINVGRGELIDEDALIHALSDGTIRAAALDVFEEEPLPPGNPLWDLENCIITPHNSGRSMKYGERLADIFLENLDAFLDDRPMPTAAYTPGERAEPRT